MFSRMSIWMTMSRLFSGLIKLREKCNRYAQFPVYLQLKWQLQKKLHRHFQGLWCRPGRTADLQGVATWVPNYQTVKLDRIFAPFGIWHFITSTTHIICFWNPLKPPWNLSPFFATSQLFKPSKFQQVFQDIFSCCSWTKKVEGSRWRRRTGQRGWRQYTGGRIPGHKRARVELLSRTLVQCPGSMMLMVMEWLVRLRWSISPRWWEGSSFHWHMYVHCTRQKISKLNQSGHNTGFDRADSCWSPLRRHDGEGGGWGGIITNLW